MRYSLSSGHKHTVISSAKYAPEVADPSLENILGEHHIGRPIPQRRLFCMVPLAGSLGLGACSFVDGAVAGLMILTAVVDDLTASAA